MFQYHIMHLNDHNQIGQAYAIQSLLIIFPLLLGAIILTFKKKKAGEDFISVDTGNGLRGIALILLLFGHFAITCVEGTLFFEVAGRWAVIFFLYLSGVGLVKTYGLADLDNVFILKRLKRLAFPVWISLTLFFLLEYYLLGHSYSWKKITLNFLGVLSQDPPNGPAWFITYILFLYGVYFCVSKFNSSNFWKVALMLVLCYICNCIIWKIRVFRLEFSNWIQYSFVFPASVTIGIYRKPIAAILSRIYKWPLLYFSLMLLFAFFFFLSDRVYSDPNFYGSPLLIQICYSFNSALLIIAMTMASLCLDRFMYSSRILSWLGRYSFEIYLIHLPFMAYYDFFLFRRPLYLFFYIYLSLITLLGLGLKKSSDFLTQRIFALDFLGNRQIHSRK